MVTTAGRIGARRDIPREKMYEDTRKGFQRLERFGRGERWRRCPQTRSPRKVSHSFSFLLPFPPTAVV